MVTTDTRSNNEEITTREGFEDAREAFEDMYQRDSRDPSQANEFGLFLVGYQAAKTDELAFLESLMVGDGDDYPYNAIERRIAALKGESRG